MAQYSLWDPAAPPTPARVTDSETKAVQLGVKFQANVAGSITGLRFYKGPQNTGTHVGKLWTATGTQLATATFANETSGWQQVSFTNPVPITAGTTYVASYHAPNGRYSINENYFTQPRTNGPLTAPASSSGNGNGVYRYGASTVFPNQTFRASNYWVDVVFQEGATNSPPVANNDSTTTNEDTAVTINVLANDTDPDGNPLSVSAVNTTGTKGNVKINPDYTITYDPGQAFQALNTGQTNTDSFSYTVSDGNGGTSSATVSLTITGITDPPSGSNPIVAENALPGSPRTEWDIAGAGNSNIQGFATDMSVNQGDTVGFKINTNSTNYRIDIYRLGYYGGSGARKVAELTHSGAQIQPNPLRDPATGLVDAGNWSVSDSWAVPAEAVSGVYIAKLVRQDGTSGENHIPFIVRDDDGQSDLVMQTSDTTWQAYNTWGGNSLYVGSPGTNPNRAYKVSYNRPFTNRGDTTGSTGPRDFLFDSDYPMLRWMEANGYNVSYISGMDTDRRGAELLEHKAFVTVGHDEYWSGQQRANVEAARTAGVNLAFFAGNDVFWKTRWEGSIDPSRTPYRTLVSYKETHANAKIDPSSEWTGTWRDPQFSPPSDGGRPENRLTGTIFTVNDGSVDRITVPAEDGKMRFWRNTDIASLAPGQSTTLTANPLTYEWNEDLDNGSRPPGLFRLSTTSDPATQYLLDNGSIYGSRSAQHNMTMYRASSGALVFSAGTPRWPWGLDPTHDTDQGGFQPLSTDNRMKQATVNLFADMGVQPGSLQSGLVAATKSTDTTPPASTIASPSNNQALQTGQLVSITGSASDVGGVVGGVEVSVDDGASWHPANGRSNWTYNWTPQTSGTYTIRSRATDDSGSLETPGTAVSVTVGSSSPPPPSGTVSIWSNSVIPAVIEENDSSPVELGVKFRASQAGNITGIRFYKGPRNTGTHIGKLWRASDQELLATTTFVNETASGWQQVDFASPVPIQANITYVASYHTPSGFYSQNEGYFSNAVTNGPLTALADGTDGGNGVFAYGPSGTFPNSSWNKANYWVDVVFQPSSVMAA